MVSDQRGAMVFDHSQCNSRARRSRSSPSPTSILGRTRSSARSSWPSRSQGQRLPRAGPPARKAVNWVPTVLVGVVATACNWSSTDGRKVRGAGVSSSGR
ncbi:hypothetical protein ACWEDZ_40085 [Streptomyces sp. NPDC005047]